MDKHNIPLPNWRDLAKTHPSAFLLAAQLVSLVLYATFDGNASGRALLGAFGVLILTLVVWVVNRSPAINWIAWILVAPAVVLSLLSILLFDPSLLVWSALLEAVLYFYAAGSLVAYMMKDYRVTTDELFAAGATFTLLAWGFAYVYLICQIWFPGSFFGMIEPGQPRTFLELLFLSFTNLSSVGVSDIMPVSPPARVFVMLEQFAGIGYIAVVVSRLIGMTIIHQHQMEKEKL
ncbi:MAG TPA: potassium channel family protein [Anaerolineales bacterium]|nr:potassium channel family protein [Anaerolineales bacterium]